MSTITKALQLLDEFSNAHPEIGLAEFQKLSGFDKATVHRYLTNLRDCGFLEHNSDSKTYRLGPAVIRLAAVRENTVPLKAIAAPLIDRLASDTGELVHGGLPQRQGMSAFYAKDGGKGGTRVGFDEAELLPYHATSSGISMLAFGEKKFTDSVLSNTLPTYTKETVSTTKQVLALIKDTQALGYAYANQLYETEVRSIAMPFFSTDLNAFGTIAIATPASRMDDATRAKLAVVLSKTSRQLTSVLGGQVPPTLSLIWDKL